MSTIAEFLVIVHYVAGNSVIASKHIPRLAVTKTQQALDDVTGVREGPLGGSSQDGRGRRGLGSRWRGRLLVGTGPVV